MRTFNQYTITKLTKFLGSLSVKRNIKQIHIHHTWKPTQKDYTGLRTIEGIYNYHVKQLKWSDIGQHFAVAPDGTIWDGRDLNRDPASIKGHNEGAISIEMIGNFDKGHDVLTDAQKEAVVELVRLLLKKFNLYRDDIIFHREYDASKTCPGSGIEKADFLKWVRGNMVGKVVQADADVVVNGKTLNTPAIIIDGVSYLPVRETAEFLGVKVDWDGRVILKK